MSDKAIRVLEFDGKETSWTMWQAKYQARARTKGWIKVLLGKETPPKFDKVIDISTALGKTEEKLCEVNEQGYSDLLLSMEDEIAFGLVDEAKTNDQPDGDLHTAWKALVAKYQPATVNALVQLKQELMNCVMSSGENPEEYVQRVETLNRKVKSIDAAKAMDVDSLLIHVCGNAPEEYDHIMPNLQKRIGQGLTIADLKADMKVIYDILQKRTGSQKLIDKALITTGGKFKGKCGICGKTGHKGDQCWEKQENKDKRPANWKPKGKGSNDGGKFKGTCNYCGKKGHKEEKCWKKKADLYQKQNGNDSANVSKEKEIVEKVLMAFDKDGNDDARSTTTEQRQEELMSDEESKQELKRPERPQQPVVGYCVDRWDREQQDRAYKKYEEEFNEYRLALLKYVAKANDPSEPKVYDGENDHYMVRHVNGVPQNPLVDPYFTKSLKPGSQGMKNAIALYDIAIDEYSAWKTADNERMVSEYKQSLEKTLFGPKGKPNTQKKIDEVLERKTKNLNEKKRVQEIDEGDKKKAAKLEDTPDTALVLETNKTSGHTLLVKANDKITEKTWLADSAASSHMTTTMEGMYDIETLKNHFVQVGGKAKLRAIARGKIDVIIQQKNGDTISMTLTNVLCTPELGYNLVSLTKAFLVGGYKLAGDKNGLQLRKGDVEFTFDRVIQSGTGVLLGVEMIKVQQEKPETAAVVLAEGTKVSYAKMHALLGHVGEDRIRATAKKLKLQLTGRVSKCEDCAVSKARQTNLNQEAENKSTVPGQRLLFDISSIKGKSYGGAKFWLLVIDEATDYCMSIFLTKKNHLGKEMLKLLRELKTKGYNVEYLRCDNAGENRSFQEMVRETEDLHPTFEFTAPGTPQQNGKPERKFATLFGRVRSMLNGANLTQKMRDALWAECGATATKLDNVCATDAEKDCPWQAFHKTKEMPKWMRDLKTFGEIGIVTNHKDKKIRGKLDDRGYTAIFTGYSDDHAGGVYRFINTKTRRAILSRDVLWLNKSWGEWKGLVNQPKLSDDDDDDRVAIRMRSDESENNSNDQNNTNDNETELSDNDEEVTTEPEGTRRATRSARQEMMTPMAQPGTRLHRELAQLETYYNRTLTPGVTPNRMNRDEEDEGTNSEIENAEIALISLMSGGRDPLTFREAWDHPDPEERAKWREAIRKEFHDMNKRRVWRYIRRRDVPNNRRLIGCKWVFKKKRNGVYRARLVALGYSQIPGVDFTENFSPVVDDITFRLALVYAHVFNLEIELIDVETAFLYGELIEEIYMEIPEGLEQFEDIPEDCCTQLQATLYGLVQASRMFWKKFMKCMVDKLGFKQSRADPCLLIKTDIDDGVCLVCTYVDDIAVIGSAEAREYVRTEIRKYFETKESSQFNDYLGVNVVQDFDGFHLRQDDILQRLEKHFGNDIKGVKAKTPLSSGTTIIKARDDSEILNDLEQSKYRSGVGSLNYLVKHTRPEISNAVRDLSKVLGNATKAHLKNMYHTIKFVLDTKKWGLVFKPIFSGTWRVVAYSDSTFASDRDNRRSVTGYCIYVNGALIAWKSRIQKNVTLSSTEAEYVAISETCMAMMHIKQLLEFMGRQIELPMTLRVDNIGAMYLANNATSSRTRHIDTRYHYVRELCDEMNPIVKLEFCRSEENKADMYTKNLAQGSFEKLNKGNHDVLEEPVG